MANLTLAPNPWFTGFDDEGNIVPGGKLFTYAAGTSDKKNTYTDVAGLVANTNPIILDDAGRVPSGLFLLPSSYKFILSPADDTDPPTNPIRTQDNIGAVPTTDIDNDVTGVAGEAMTAGQAAYLSDGSGALIAGRWYLADADNTYSSTLPEVAFVVTTVAAGATGTFRLSGRDTNQSGLTPGDSYYLSATAGAITATAPANSRFVGQADTITSLIASPNPPITLILPGTSTITTTGTQTALAIPAGTGPMTIFANNATLLTIQGIAAGLDGQQLTIFSKGAGQIDLANQNASAAEADRIINGVTGTISLAAGSGRVVLEYDSTTARWRVVVHEQGAWITPTFNAGDFTIPAGATWTVAAGDVTTYAYYLRGRQLTVAWMIITSTIVTGGQRPAYIKIPGSLTSAKQMYAMGISVDNGGAAVAGAIEVLAAATNIGVYATQSPLTGNWTAGVDNMAVRGEITFEVQ